MPNLQNSEHTCNESKAPLSSPICNVQVNTPLRGSYLYKWDSSKKSEIFFISFVGRGLKYVNAVSKNQNTLATIIFSEVLQKYIRCGIAHHITLTSSKTSQ